MRTSPACPAQEQRGVTPRWGQEKVLFVQEWEKEEDNQDTRSWAVHVGIAHWEIGMDGAAVSLEDNRGINIKE